MPIQNDSLNTDLYNLLRSKGYDPVSKDATGKTVPVPNEADVFKFQFKKDGESTDDVWATIDSSRNLTLYYDDAVAGDDEESWDALRNHLKNWSMRRQLGFKLENKDHLASDMAQRDHMRKKEEIAEGYYPMGKQSSYNDSIPTVKIVLQHTRQIQEGEQRFRHISKIYLENVQGERILAPTTRPGIAQVYARHLAEGGVPNDERWNHIKSLCEEYSKMAGFVRAVRGNQFNESAQRLVEAGLNHYAGLRETLGKMRGHRGYSAYFESWTPTLMETDGDDTNLNELFVQETLDPRIESVMPILSKLKLNLGEMKEVSELAEWAESVTEEEGRAALNPVGIPESDDLMEFMDPDKRARLDDLIDQFRDATDPSDYGNDYNDPEDAIALIRAEFGDKIADQVAAGADKMHFGHHEIQRSDPLSWKTYRGKNRVTKGGKLFKQDSDYLKNTIKSRYKLSGRSATEESVEEGMAPSVDEQSTIQYAQKISDAIKQTTGATVRINRQKDGSQQIVINPRPDNPALGYMVPRGDVGATMQNVDAAIDDYYRMFRQKGWRFDQPVQGQFTIAVMQSPQQGVAEAGVEEGLDANQKRAGQLGPTEKVKNNNIGKLVGANESVEKDVTEGSVSKEKQKTPYRDINSPESRAAAEKQRQQMAKDKAAEPGKKLLGKIANKGVSEGLNEMDSEGYTGTRDEGDPYAKGGKATPIPAKKAKKDFLGVLNKSMDKAHKAKKDTDEKVAQHQVKEGQEDLDAILRIIRK